MSSFVGQNGHRPRSCPARRANSCQCTRDPFYFSRWPHGDFLENPRPWPDWRRM